MRLFSLFLLLLAFSVQAQTVYKCKGDDGNPVYQSSPCPGGASPERVWGGTYRQPTNEELWARYRRDQESQRRREQERARRSVYVAPSPRPFNPQAMACASLRQEYDRVQANPRLNRDIDLLRRLEARLRVCAQGRIPEGR